MLVPSLPGLTNVDVGLIVAGAGKVFIEIADSMPDPGPNANYFVRWVYAFLQKLASNGLKAEASRSGGVVMVMPKPMELSKAA